MDKIRISMVSGAALLALSSTAWAGPMPVASEKALTPPAQIAQAHYYRHHHRHYVWHHHHHYVWRHGWHYGWYRARVHHRHPYYAYRYPGYYDYGQNPVGAAANTALGLATFGLATGGWPYYGYPSYAYYGYPYYY